MRYLLDTQVWLWMVARPDRLAPSTRDLLARGEHQLFLSAASAWEIAIKHGLGKLVMPDPVDRVIPDLMQRTAVQPLVVTHAHALRVARLPPHHRDPFDRLLVAQAQLEQLPLVTADPALTPYDVEVIEAS